MLRTFARSRRYAFDMRSTPEIDARLRERLREGVEYFAGGSADKLGRLLGYANGGYIRESLRPDNPKPVRAALINKFNDVPEMRGWFAHILPAVSIADLSGGPDALSARALEIARIYDTQLDAKQQRILYASALAAALPDEPPEVPGAARAWEPPAAPKLARVPSAARKPRQRTASAPDPALPGAETPPQTSAIEPAHR